MTQVCTTGGQSLCNLQLFYNDENFSQEQYDEKRAKYEKWGSPFFLEGKRALRGNAGHCQHG